MTSMKGQKVANTVVKSSSSTNGPDEDLRKLWFIHGKAYDLASFVSKHPGGESILLDSRGRDSTPLFESYHAFANQKYILEKLETFKVDRAVSPNDMVASLYSYEETGFYHTLVRRVREHFGANGKMSVTVNSQVKATKTWYLKVLLQLCVLFLLACVTFFPSLSQALLPWTNSMGYWEELVANVAIAFATGVFFIQVGFTIMHDASHFAIAEKNGWQNEVLARMWCALSLWRYELWMHHHSVLHHAYTGDAARDPDILHAKPLIRKHPSTARYQYVGIDFERFAKHGFSGTLLTSLWVVAVYAFLPGMWLGQIAAYWLIWNPRGHLWRMSLPDVSAFPRTWYEQSLNVLVVVLHLQRANPLVSWALFVGCNVAYAVCILPDHDTMATIENHSKESTGEELAKADWGETQVRHSANFATGGISGFIFSALFGGINYQIEHHLFPGMSHVHYRAVSPIVQRTCEEFGIPYEAFPSVTTALLDFIRNVQTQMRQVLREEESSTTKFRTKAL